MIKVKQCDDFGQGHLQGTQGTVESKFTKKLLKSRKYCIDATDVTKLLTGRDNILRYIVY